MYDEQLYLLACIYISRGDSIQLQKLYPRLRDSEDFINAVIVLWPELDDPLKLKFLFQDNGTSEAGELPSRSKTDEDLLISMVSGNDELISTLELDSVAISERARLIRSYVAFELYRRELDRDADMEWIKKRILLCNDIDPGNTISYLSLLEELGFRTKSEFVSLRTWVDGILLPLAHLNKRLDRDYKLRMFMELSFEGALALIMSGNPDREVIQNELIPYLSDGAKGDPEELVAHILDKYWNTEHLRLTTREAFETFETMFLGLIDYSTKLKLDPQSIYSRALSMIFNNSAWLLQNTPEDQIEDVLSRIPEGTNIGDDNSSLITPSRLIDYLTLINSFFKDFNFVEMNGISQEEDTAQLAHLTTLCEERITEGSGKFGYRRGQSPSDAKCLQALVDILIHERDKRRRIFTKLSFEQIYSAIYETLLNLGEFGLVERFDSLGILAPENDDTEGNNIVQLQIKALEKYFWHYFNNATNGSSKRTDMTKASKILKILKSVTSLDTSNESEQPSNSSSSYETLETLLEVSDELSHYSMNMGKGIPFKPANILDFKDDPIRIITILLELNKGLYRDIDTTFGILRKTWIGLGLKPSESQLYTEYTKLLALHIDHSLANLDFEFAYERAIELMSRRGDDVGRKYWLSILQVGKFRDPNWLDGEIPTEILTLKMEILSKLLEICPVEEVEIVTSQWSALELELTSRDLVHDKYSLEANGVKRGTLLAWGGNFF